MENTRHWNMLSLIQMQISLKPNLWYEIFFVDIRNTWASLKDEKCEYIEKVGDNSWFW